MALQRMAFLIWAALPVCLGVPGGAAWAACTSGVSSCTVSDFRNAAKASGCGLLFIATRNQNCTTAGESLHTDTSCGPIGRSPPACAQGQDNRARLARWQQCLADRLAQQSAFASGLSDVEAARKVEWKTGKKDITGFLNTIAAAIMKGQKPHADEIAGVKTTIANCKKFPDTQ